MEFHAGEAAVCVVIAVIARPFREMSSVYGSISLMCLIELTI
jgi:hypothetical protein